MLNLLQTLVGKSLDLLIHGRLFTGTIISIDVPNSILVFADAGSNYYININSIDTVHINQ
jgi:hypothetical protein